MIAQLLGWCIVALVTVALIKALMAGRIEFDPGGQGFISADRSKEPAAFWTIFIIGLSTDFFFLWFLLL